MRAIKKKKGFRIEKGTLYTMRVQGLGFRVQVFRVEGLGFRVESLGFRV